MSMANHLTFEELIGYVERLGYNWLVRSAPEKGGYFANVTSPNFRAHHTITTGSDTVRYTGVRFPAEGQTMELALRNAVVQLDAHLATEE